MALKNQGQPNSEIPSQEHKFNTGSIQHPDQLKDLKMNKQNPLPQSELRHLGKLSLMALAQQLTQYQKEVQAAYLDALEQSELPLMDKAEKVPNSVNILRVMENALSSSPMLQGKNVVVNAWVSNNLASMEQYAVDKDGAVYQK